MDQDDLSQAKLFTLEKIAVVLAMSNPLVCAEFRGGDIRLVSCDSSNPLAYPIAGNGKVQDMFFLRADAQCESESFFKTGDKDEIIQTIDAVFADRCGNNGKCTKRQNHWVG